MGLACDDGSGDDDASAGASSGETAAGDDALAPCEEQPVITYDTFGRGFLATYCDGCHGAAVTHRQGAPAEVTFDTREQALAFADRILARTAPADGEPTMPPVGGVTQEDRERLLVWLGCWE